MFGCEGKPQATPLISECRAAVWESSAAPGVSISPMGEEEVEVTKSEVPVLTGAWCKRETLRTEAE